MTPELGSNIVFAVERVIKQKPDQAAREILKLIRANADLRAENAMLRARLAAMGGDHYEYGFSG